MLGLLLLLKLISISLILLFEAANQRQDKLSALFALCSPLTCFLAGLISTAFFRFYFGPSSVSLTTQFALVRMSMLTCSFESLNFPHKPSLETFRWLENFVAVTSHISRSEAMLRRACRAVPLLHQLNIYLHLGVMYVNS